MALAQHGAGDPRFFGKAGPHGLAGVADVRAGADAKAGADVAGSPAPVREFFRGAATLRRLARQPATSAARPE